MIIILIHGTFATNAEWTQPESLFRRELALALGGTRAIDVLPFAWNGANRHIDRRKASLQLRRLIMLKQNEQPDSSIYLIGHSHGGNIALQAARHFAAEPRLAGVVTLATPFLEFNEEAPAVTLIGATFGHAFKTSRLYASYWAAMIALSVVAYVTIGPLLLGVMRSKAWIYGQVPLCSPLLGPEFCSQLQHGTTLIFAGLYALIFVTGLVFFGYQEAAKEQRANIDRMRRSISRYFYVQPPKSLERLEILSLSAPADEALQILNGSWWAHRLGISAARLIGAVAIVGALAGLAAVMTGVVAYVQANRFVPDQALATTLLLCGAFSLAVPLVFVAAALVAQLINVVGSFPAPGLGLAGGERSLLWSVHARRQLLQTTNHVHRTYGWWELVLGRGGGLMHSRLYGSAVAIRDIAVWLAGREAKRLASVTARENLDSIRNCVENRLPT